MSIIKLQTTIHAPVKICYDLSRSIDVHTLSMKHTRKEAIEGTTEGLINAGETVTWKAIHFGVAFKMKVKITETLSPFFFEDIMVHGPFKSMKHTHLFQKYGNTTLMTDVFEYELPYSIAGKLCNYVFVHYYLKKLLRQRNLTIKSFAETNHCENYLN